MFFCLFPPKTSISKKSSKLWGRKKDNCYTSDTFGQNKHSFRKLVQRVGQLTSYTYTESVAQSIPGSVESLQLQASGCFIWLYSPSPYPWPNVRPTKMTKRIIEFIARLISWCSIDVWYFGDIKISLFIWNFHSWLLFKDPLRQGNSCDRSALLMSQNCAISLIDENWIPRQYHMQFKWG